MRVSILLIVLLFSACSRTPEPAARPEPSPVPRSADADQFIKRMNEPGVANLQQSALKTLSTDFSDFKKSDTVMNQTSWFLRVLSRYENGDRIALDEYGGIAKFTDKCAVWIKDDDQSIRAFGAVMIGVSGDKSFAPQLAELLTNSKYAEKDKVKYDRGRAAIALGMIGAEDYKPQLAKMLTSSEYNDRQGAALGLGFLKAKEYAKEVARLQDDKEPNVRDDARGALKLMGADELIRK
ncbi:MAG: HEAT repeat domain-containing protein [Acidobacteria bacterium]|nr:HEAT repeat domain-containing protein [Acidobacteriota bacterium]